MCVMEKQLIGIFIFVAIAVRSVVSTERSVTAPLITPNQADVTVSPGENYTFTCESSEPVRWFYDDYINRAYVKGFNRKLLEQPLNFNPEISHSWDSGGGLWKSVIELRNIDFTFVGYYYCVKNASKEYEFTYLEQTKQASRIYLFVDDPNHGAVLTDNFVLTDDPNYVIPCKPITKNVLLELSVMYTALSEIISTELGRIEFDFSEYKGFKPTYITDKVKTIIYNCTSNRSSKLLWEHHIVTVNSANADMEVYITLKNDSATGDLELTCTVEDTDRLHNLNITWTTPNVAERENRTKIEKLSKQENSQTFHFLFGTYKYKYISTLTIANFSNSKDGGEYQCNVCVGSTHINSTHVNIGDFYS